MKPEYSIIIPHYNSLELLEKCISTIPDRDDVEIIVVDDCSKLEIADISNCIGSGRSNVTVIKTDKNGGGGKARNVGIKKATGHWLLFADCDDYFTPELMALLDKYKNRNDVDIVYLNSQIVHEDCRGSESMLFSRYIKNYKKHRFYSEKVLRYGMYTPWSRMVSASMVNNHNIQFEEIRTGNDAMFCLNCSKYARNIEVEESIIYNYYRPSDGSFCSQNRFKYDNIVARVELGLRMNKLYDSVGYVFKESFLLGYYQNKDKEYRKALIEVIKGHRINLLSDFYHLILFFAGKIFRII